MLKLKAQDKEILKQIKQTILEVAKDQGIEIDKIILFGSRARGDYREDSDWDILVVTKRKLDKDKKFHFIVKVHWELVVTFESPFDILVCDRQLFDNTNKFWNVIWIAKKEGIEI